jgi:hypothetical protein
MKRVRLALIGAATLLVAVSVIWIFLFVAHRSHPNKTYFNQSGFVTGVNYPWHNYGSDFGTSPWGHAGVSEPATAAAVDRDFAQLHDMGVTVVRWFVLCDTRSGLVFDRQGYVVGLDKFILDDMQAAVDIAHKHDIRLIFVVLDFLAFRKPTYANGIQFAGRTDLVSNPAKRQSFLDNAFKPILQKFGNSKDILDWEIINEPEWAMDFSASQFAGMINRRLSSAVIPRVKTSDMQQFVYQAVALVHKYSGQGATIGSATRGWLAYWTGCNLDVYQFHYYPWMEFKFPYDAPAAELNLDKPVIIGEFGTRKGGRSTQQYLEDAARNGYAGAFAWSMHATDAYTNFDSAAPQIRRFTSQRK